MKSLPHRFCCAMGEKWLGDCNINTKMKRPWFCSVRAQWTVAHSVFVRLMPFSLKYCIIIWSILGIKLYGEIILVAVFINIDCVSTNLLLVLVIFAVSISGCLQTPLSLTCKIQTQCALLSHYESSHPISGLWLMVQLGLGLCETVHIYGETKSEHEHAPKHELS